MFSFHKPKVYRSTTGCCICKAKSSSSRFTDSKKYESDFIKCFHLTTPRQGEICNACVLLVKRWKKLPPGSTRNWQHVVDARAGPGMKSMTKFKSKHKKQLLEDAAADGVIKTTGTGVGRKKNHFEREYSPLSDKSDGTPDADMDIAMDYLEMATSGGSSRTNSPGGSDCEETVQVNKQSRRHKSQAKRRVDSLLPMVSEFIDMDIWKKVKICCGTIFESPNGEFLVDSRFLKPCGARLSCKMNGVLPKQETEISAAKSFSDSSSDSGYDESSNQGNGENASNFSSGTATSNANATLKQQKQVSIALAGQAPNAN